MWATALLILHDLPVFFNCRLWLSLAVHDLPVIFWCEPWFSLVVHDLPGFFLCEQWLALVVHDLSSFCRRRPWFTVVLPDISDSHSHRQVQACGATLCTKIWSIVGYIHETCDLQDHSRILLGV